ncbi:MAG: glycosyltransferase [Bacteroidota bacterium]
MSQADLNGKHIIYIGRELKSIDGGAVVSKRNVEILREISGGKIIEFYLSDKTILSKLINIVADKPWGYSSHVYSDIKNSILLNEISFVFIDHSLLGAFAYILKKLNVTIVVFFHNIEVKYYKDKVLVDGFLNNLMVRYARNNEKLITKYADKIICLTNVDSDLLLSIYGRKADLILPITIEDRFIPSIKLEDTENYHLFVGSSFFANIDAINWYIENVLPSVSSKLVIIGNGMEVLSKQYKRHPKIEIKGFVDDLEPFYSNADFVINPVRLGSGMKTKTIEALMYGKTVIGTTEAFVGMEDVENKGIGYVCGSPDDFVSCINNFHYKKLNKNSRIYYLGNFSVDIGYQKLKKFLCNNG